MPSTNRSSVFKVNPQPNRPIEEYFHSMASSAMGIPNDNQATKAIESHSTVILSASDKDNQYGNPIDPSNETMLQTKYKRKMAEFDDRSHRKISFDSVAAMCVEVSHNDELFFNGDDESEDTNGSDRKMKAKEEVINHDYDDFNSDFENDDDIDSGSEFESNSDGRDKKEGVYRDKVRKRNNFICTKLHELNKIY